MGLSIDVSLAFFLFSFFPFSRNTARAKQAFRIFILERDTARLDASLQLAQTLRKCCSTSRRNNFSSSSHSAREALQSPSNSIFATTP